MPGVSVVFATLQYALHHGRIESTRVEKATLAAPLLEVGWQRCKALLPNRLAAIEFGRLELLNLCRLDVRGKGVLRHF